MAFGACITGAHALRAQAPAASDWGYYGGDAFGQRFSTLDQINRNNVQRLTVAWTYRTGELGDGCLQRVPFGSRRMSARMRQWIE